VLTSVARLLVYATIYVPTPALAPLVAGAQDATADSGVPAQSIATSFPQSGDADSRRKVLAARGITYGLNFVGECQANVSGGVSRGSDYIGRLEDLVNVDLGKIAGWQGLMFHFNGY
jgi:porin